MGTDGDRRRTNLLVAVDSRFRGNDAWGYRRVRSPNALPCRRIRYEPDHVRGATRGLPGDRLPVAEEAAGGAAVWERRGPHEGFGPFFDGTRGAGTAHVGLHPPGVDGVDEDAATAQLGGKDAREDVERGLGDAVARGATAHVLQGREPRRDVDDAPVAVAPHKRNRQLAEAPGPEQVSLKRLLHPLEVGVHAALAIVVGDCGVVHQDVEPPELLLDGDREPLDALSVRHVQLVDDHAVGELGCGGPALLSVPGTHDHRDSPFSELAADLQPDPAVSPAHKRDPPVLHRTTSRFSDTSKDTKYYPPRSPNAASTASSGEERTTTCVPRSQPSSTTTGRPTFPACPISESV